MNQFVERAEGLVDETEVIRVFWVIYFRLNWLFDVEDALRKR